MAHGRCTRGHGLTKPRTAPAARTHAGRNPPRLSSWRRAARFHLEWGGGVILLPCLVSRRSRSTTAPIVIASPHVHSGRQRRAKARPRTMLFAIGCETKGRSSCIVDQSARHTLYPLRNQLFVLFPSSLFRGPSSWAGRTDPQRPKAAHSERPEGTGRGRAVIKKDSTSPWRTRRPLFSGRVHPPRPAALGTRFWQHTTPPQLARNIAKAI